MSSFEGDDPRGAGKRMPGSPSWDAGVNRRSESQRRRQASPMRSCASRITKSWPRRERW
jgi:hypothetical protein